MDPMRMALIALGVVVTIAIFLYIRPRFLSEGFSTIALDEATMPRCFTRSPDAQELLSMLSTSASAPANSDAGMAHAELKLILQKMLCIDADITGAGAGVYSTYALPFATSHDIEPAASFVNRCVRHAVRSRDLEVAFGKFEDRGTELINTLCADDAQRRQVLDKFHTIVASTLKAVSTNCLMSKDTMDKPAGPRDPGYFLPPSLENVRPYTISGGDPEYI
jgi:hypothetical protein